MAVTGWRPAAGWLVTVLAARGDAVAAPPVKAPASISITVASPVDILVTDPEGHRTGTDTHGRKVLLEIPGASYEPNNGLVIGKSGESNVVKLLEVPQPAPGDYDLQVTGTARGTYALEVRTRDPGSTVWTFQATAIPIGVGEVHNYALGFPSKAGQPTDVTGTFDGGSSRSGDAGSLLTYVLPSSVTTTVPNGQMYSALHLVYGACIRPETFKATLNGEDISRIFSPAPSRSQAVNLQLRLGTNVLLLTVTGRLQGGKVATDFDRLVFKVP